MKEKSRLPPHIQEFSNSYKGMRLTTVILNLIVCFANILALTLYSIGTSRFNNWSGFGAFGFIFIFFIIMFHGIIITLLTVFTIIAIMPSTIGGLSFSVMIGGNVLCIFLLLIFVMSGLGDGCPNLSILATPIVIASITAMALAFISIILLSTTLKKETNLSRLILQYKLRQHYNNHY